MFSGNGSCVERGHVVHKETLPNKAGHELPCRRSGGSCVLVLAVSPKQPHEIEK